MTTQPKTPNPPSWPQPLFFLALSLSLAAVMAVFGPVLWDRYRVVEDMHVYYWMARAQDPTLFDQDYLYRSDHNWYEIKLAGFPITVDVYSLGYSLIFYLGSVWIDYIWLGKWSVFILMPICVGYLFKLGQFVRDDLTGFSVSMLFVFFILASPQSISIATGLQRAFALPLLIPFLYYLVRQQYIGAGLIIFLSTLIYLPIFPPMILAYGFTFFDFKPPFRVALSLSRAKLLPFIITLLFSVLVVGVALSTLLNLWSPIQPDPATAVVAQNKLPISENPFFQGEGSVALFLSFPFLGRAGVFDAGADVVNFLVLSILAVLIYKIVGSQTLRRLPQAAWYLLVAGVIMYGLSLVVLLGLSSTILYLPSRYTRTTLFLLPLCFVGLNWLDFLHQLPGWFYRNARLVIFFFISLAFILSLIYLLTPNRLLLIPLLWLVALILIALFVPLIASGLFWLARRDGLGKSWQSWTLLIGSGLIVLALATVYIRILGLKVAAPSASEWAAYQFITTLPKDTVIAGDPDIMTSVPLFARRSILFRSLFPRPEAPVVEYFEAQYAETPQAILDFCQHYGISYLLIDTSEFTPEYVTEGKFFYPPWNDLIVERVAKRSHFVLPNLPSVFTSGSLRIIKCDAKTILATN